MNSADRTDRKKLWLASRIMFGVKFDAALWEELTMGVMMNWETSSTYQDIIQRGKNQGQLQSKQDDVLELGTKKFGPPPAALEAVVRETKDLARLKLFLSRVLDVNSWDELLSDSSPSRGDGA